MLYIVATPIGNLEDITFRALRILKEADYILCEDTRVTRKILDHYGFNNKRLVSYHQHSKPRKVKEIVKLVQNNKVALVTDAGTPGISDPGNKLIAEILKADLKFKVQIIPIPGASALAAALSISGLPTDKFIFKGFVPHKKGRERFLLEAVKSKITVIFYESPHRIIKTLEQLDKFCKNEALSHLKRIIVCRELTKKFETIYRGTAGEILEQIKKDFPNKEGKSQPKGEFVVVVG